MIDITSTLELIEKLFEAMRNDINIMSEHGDSEKSLELELINADNDILQEYAKIYL